MRPYTFSILLLPLVAADVIPAIRRDAPKTHIDERQSNNPLLGKRQVCNQYYPDICFASNGNPMCMALDEVCCQVMTTDGAVPYVCPVTYPYCCPPQNGEPMCGTDMTCGSGSFEAAPSHPVFTETSGPKPTGKSASAAPTAAQATTSKTAANAPTNAATSKPAGIKPNAAPRLGNGALKGAMFAAVVLGGLAVL